jgi:hypothetical protein
MFHCAAPDVNGLGVITSTPSWVRSSQVVMPLGLPLRVMKATTESLTMPFVGPAFQSVSTRPASTRRVMSGSSEKTT